MRITKKGLRSLVKEMIKADKGLIKESKVVRNNPLRKMIREELGKINKGLLREAKDYGAVANITPNYITAGAAIGKDGKRLPTAGRKEGLSGGFTKLDIVGYTPAEIAYIKKSITRSKGSIMTVKTINILPQKVIARGENLVKAINDKLGVKVVDETTTDEQKITVSKNNTLIQGILGKYGSGIEARGAEKVAPTEIKQKVEFMIPKTVVTITFDGK